VSSEWRAKAREWRTGMTVERAANQVLSRPASLAGFDDARRAVLPAREDSAQGRDVRPVDADQAICRIDPSQHCIRVRARKYAQLYPVSSHCPRLAEGVGNAFAAGRTPRLFGSRRRGAGARAMRAAGQNAAFLHPLASAPGHRGPIVTVTLQGPMKPSARAESQHVTTHYSLLTTHYYLGGCPNG
jgi:hypothetical protein